MTVKLTPEIQKCIAATQPGCDWKINTDWGGEPLSTALQTLTESTELAFRVVGSDTVLIMKRATAKP